MQRTFLPAAILVLTACIAALTVPATAQSPHTHQHSFGDAEEWAQVFDEAHQLLIGVRKASAPSAVFPHALKR